MFLEKIHSSQDLKQLSTEELNLLAGELRQRMVEVVARTGGHLASSLGTVELTIALHYCLNTPQDKIIWDVGHQSYAHKILTGRNREFSLLRQYEGLSGFPCKEESVYDPFTTGHSSTAVSLALGIASARDTLPAEKQFKVVAVVGDGSLSGGLCFEGLNNAGHFKKDLLVVLNTNEHSIAPNVGALSTYLNKIISLPIYNRFRDSLENFLRSRLPNKGGRILNLANKFEEGLKNLFIPGMFFEELGFRYFGPIDGHNLALLTHTMKNILNIKGPRMLHVLTKKGKGYLPAENDPVRFHSAAPFAKDSGAALAKPDAGLKTYTEIFSQALVKLAQADKKIAAITAAMPEGTGLDRFRDQFPERFFDVGIAEQHAVCFAAGLAQQGLKPVVAVYSTFLQRAYDQIIEAVALQKLGVVFAIDRAGITGEDGPTHQGAFDLAFLRQIPNLVVMAPKDGQELEEMLAWALDSGLPVAIRYPKDKIPNPNIQIPNKSLPCRQAGQISNPKLILGSAEVLKEGDDFALVALGALVAPSLEAVELLEKEGIRGTLLNARFAKPLDLNLFRSLKLKKVFSAEDGLICGGFGSGLMEALGQPVTMLGLPDEFIPCGKREMLLEKYGLDPQGIASKIKEKLKNNG